MDISKMRLAAEHDGHFEIADHEGTFRVAKKGLSKALQAKIRKMQPMKKSAQGGEEPDGDTADAADLEGPAVDEQGQPIESMPEYRPRLSELLSIIEEGTKDVAAPDASLMPGPVVTPPPAAPLTTAVGLPPALPTEEPITTFVPKATTPPPAASPATAPTPEQIQAMAPTLAPPVQPAAPVKIPTVQVPAAPQIAGEAPEVPMLDRAAYEAALQKKTAAESAIKAAEAESKAKIASATAEMLAQDQNDLAEMKKRQTDAETDYQNARKAAEDFKIDPNRYFANMSTPAKILNILAVAIGGYSAGRNRIPNYALEALNREIERDIEAQRSQKDSIYRRFEAATKNKDRAYELTRQKMHEIASLKLAQVGAQADSDLTKAIATQFADVVALDAMQQMTQLDQNIYGMRRADRAAKLDEIVKQATLSNQRIGLQLEAQRAGRDAEKFALEKRVLEAQMAQTKAMAGDQAAMNVIVDAMSRGPTPIDPALVNRLDKGIRDRVVAVAPGQYQLAATAEDKKQIDKMLPAIDGVIQNVQGLRQYAAEHVGTGIATRAWFQADRKRLELLARNAQLSISRAESLGAYDKGTAELLGKMIPNPSEFTAVTNEALVAGYDAALANYGSLRQRVLNQRLIGNQQRVTLEQWSPPVEITRQKKASEAGTVHKTMMP
jgi:hypothetical protein